MFTWLFPSDSCSKIETQYSCRGTSVLLQAHDQAIRSMVWSHNENWMVTGDDGGSIKYDLPPITFGCTFALGFLFTWVCGYTYCVNLLIGQVLAK